MRFSFQGIRCQAVVGLTRRTNVANKLLSISLSVLRQLDAYTNPFTRRYQEMSEFDQEVKKAERELQEGLVPVADDFGSSQDEYLGDLKMQAQEYGQRLQDAAVKARDFASEKFSQAGDKIKELQDKDPKQLVEDAKDFARQKPGQAILISAAVGVVLGLLFRGRR